MAATLRHVAERAGVSVSTVSRAFSHPHLLAPQTVARVTAIAQEVGYVPNPLARGLITGTAANVGLIVPNLASRFFAELVKAAQARAREAGQGVLIAGTDGAAETEADAVRQFGPQVGGVILCSPRTTSARLKAMAADRPVVLVNRRVPGIPSVVVDTAAAVRAAVDLLADGGHRRVAYLPGPGKAWSDGERRRAVRERCAELGIEAVVLPEWEQAKGGHAGGVEAVPELLASGATAVVAFDDAIAAGVLTGLGDAGVAVPGRISVVGCDDMQALECRPRLTSITGRIGDAGRSAVELLLSLREGARGRSVRLPAELVVRESTGPRGAG
ncbi:hypothetical protein BIV57_14970 [Mangrovactinospora gilvigrisea]|uniref:HTH lacI-type domain-containing protein n=1 Tax=Mangrovactinospora gilvigrisea TaxID=1428644 RepID=A0A1J7BDE1_9ACTN|nr:LacI family DNA-binding transcriptional regulator [Mangrovactinospora gilvigrisea]OIV36670.1 hypothetical protein BIV57_14970 [Mangrovactinospora gilvigrisea]